MKKTAAVLLLSIAALVSQTSLYASESPVFIRGSRPLGMGGAFVAVADDQNAVFYNPAGLTQRQGGQFTLFELPMNISDDVLKFYSFYKDNEDKLKDFEKLSPDVKIDLLNQINDKITTYRPKVRLGFPNCNYVSKSGFLSWGLGVYNQEDIGFQFNRSLIVPSISFWGNADVVLAAPIAHRFEHVPFVPGKLSAGATLKYINRARIAEYNKSVLEFENFDPALQWGTGIGADLGALYQPTDRWNFGLQVTDFGGTNMKFNEVKATKAGELDKPAFTGMIEPQTNVGFAYIPSKIYYWPGHSIGTQDRLIFAFDVRDVTSSDEPLFEATFWKKVQMGAELRWGPVSLRGGFSSGYPSFGAGFRIPYLGLKADYAFWGDETGRYAGQMPVWNHQVAIALSWGDSGGRAYGSKAARPESAVAKKLSKEEKKGIEQAADKALQQNDAAAASSPAAANAGTGAPAVTPATSTPAAVSTETGVTEAVPAAVAPASANTEVSAPAPAEGAQEQASAAAETDKK